MRRGKQTDAEKAGGLKPCGHPLCGKGWHPHSEMIERAKQPEPAEGEQREISRPEFEAAVRKVLAYRPPWSRLERDAPLDGGGAQGVGVGANPIRERDPEQSNGRGK